jgi:hypothetical protein
MDRTAIKGGTKMLGTNPSQKIEPVKRTLLVTNEGGQARLPKANEVLEGGWIRAIFDPVSLAALFGSLGYKVRTHNAERLLKQLPAEGETAMAGVPDVRQ